MSADHVRIDPTELIRDLMDYMEFGQEDLARIRALAPILKPHFTAMADTFYGSILRNEDAKAVIENQEQIDRLKKTLIVWVRSLLYDERDAAYVESRLAVGRMHVRIGLEQRYVHSAMNVIQVFLLGHVSAAMGTGDVSAFSDSANSLCRALALDLNLICESYQEAYVERMLHEERARAMLEAEAETQGQLAHQEKMAALGTQAAGVAHEIGNPLMSIFAIAQNLARKSEDTEQRERLDEITTHVERVARVLRDMNEFARPSTQTWEKVHVNELVEKSAKFLGYDNRAKKTVTRMNLAADLPMVRLIPDGLSQVFINLILNAYDALSNTEKPCLEISTEHVGETIVVSFSDNGPGVPEDIRQTIFEPFFTTKGPRQGTGMGLAVSYGILKEIGAGISVVEGAQGGALFSVTIPLTQAKTASAGSSG